MGIALFRNSYEPALATLKQQHSDLARELGRLKDTVSNENDKQELGLSAFQVGMTRRLEDVEATSRLLPDHHEKIQKLIADFDTWVSCETARETYTRRLEWLVRDMEGRVWPWRPNMDRSNSPPRNEDAIGQWNFVNFADDVNELMPPQSSGIMKASPDTSHGPTPPLSARPTPPTSRPSSARFRGRDPGRANPNPPAATSSAAGRIRPSSALRRGRPS